MVIAMEPINHDRDVFEPHDEIHNSWPALLAKLIVDFTKVVEAEARVARASVEPILTAVLDHWLLQIAIAAVALVGCLLLLVATILLLHQWLPWWEAVGIVGAVAVVVPLAIGSATRSGGRHQHTGA